MQSSIDSEGWIRKFVRIIPGDPAMTIARAHLVDPSVTRWYHCVTRCVRRAFLLGEGMHDRKCWIEHRLEELAQGIGPGRPGWLPTQVPHRSGLAHHAHPVPHLMNSRPARSVVGTWTWFRSRCTCQVSLQRLMRRHPLPLTGFLGLVPPLQRYYEVLRLPAAHFAALRFLRLAIPSLRPWFVPPGPGRGAVDQSGVGRRYLQPPCSMETTGSPKFPEEPL